MSRFPNLRFEVFTQSNDEVLISLTPKVQVCHLCLLYLANKCQNHNLPPSLNGIQVIFDFKAH